MSDTAITALKDALAALRDLFLEWFLAALHPITKCQSLLSITDSDERLVAAIKLWTVSFIVALVVDLPLYHPIGIGLSSIEFHLSIFLCLTLAMVSCGLAIHLGLRIFGIRSTFSDVATIYTVYVMCYQPLLNLLTYFASSRMFSILGLARSQGQELDETIRFILAQLVIAGNRNDLTNDVGDLCFLRLLAESCLGSALLASTIADRYSVPRPKSFSALSFAMIVLVPPILFAQGVLVAYVEFIYMSAKGLTTLSY
jgi:hypothetical protein